MVPPGRYALSFRLIGYGQHTAPDVSVATTPVINYPEVAIVGVNKIMIRPMWDGTQFVPRKMMNLSSSFDHRVIDGWDAAVFVQRLKALLEAPAIIFVEG